VTGARRSPERLRPGSLRSDAVAIVRMFASAREAAGTARDDVPGATVGEVLSAARQRYGNAFADILGTCRIWVNGDPAADSTAVGPTDEIAVLPPVSGGAM
jgi:sulfur-carrier protein